jgi:RNA polymerase II subunit A small phosphatase-like protein
MEHVVEMKTGSSKENPDNAMAEKGAATAVESECAKPVMKNLDTSAVLLPEQKDVHKGLKTLVLDLDETLVHSGFDMIDKPDYVVQIDVSGVQRTLYVKKRPGCDRFLHEMADCFEIIVFTASLPKYADTVCDLLNQSVGRDVIAHRLFRDSCEFDVDALCFVKNLHKLGRDIKNIVIVDNSPSAYLKNVENAIPVVSWFSDETDHTLEDLIPPLREIANAEDARVAIYKSSVLQRLRETLTDNTWDSVGQT